MTIPKDTHIAEVIAELAHRKQMNPLEFFENLPLQEAFDRSEAKTKCLFGGNRSGKTEKGAEYTIKKALKIPNARIWAAAVSYGLSVEVQQRKINNLLPKAEVKYAYYDEVNGFRNEKVVFKNGSVIIFKTYEQGRKKFEGDDVDLIWLDEEPTDKGVYDECLMRLLDRGGELILTMTSLMGMTDLLQEIFDDHTIVKSQYSKMVDDTLPRIAKKNGVEFFFLWTIENPHIDCEAVIERFGQISKRELKSRAFGIPTNLAGKIYPQYNEDIHVISWDEVPNGPMNIYTVLDPHDRKPYAIQWWAVDKTNTYYVVDEYPEIPFHEVTNDDKTYKEYAAIIKEKEKKLLKIFKQSRVTGRIIDPNFGNKTVKKAERTSGYSTTTPKKELGNYGLSFTDGYDGIREGHLAVKAALDWREINGHIVKQPQMFIVDYCQNTKEFMSKYAFRNPETKDGDIKDNVGLIEKWKDFNDTTRYFITAGVRYIDWAERRREENRADNNRGRKY